METLLTTDSLEQSQAKIDDVPRSAVTTRFAAFYHLRLGR